MQIASRPRCGAIGSTGAVWSFASGRPAQSRHISNVAPQVRCRHCNKHIVITTTAALLRQLVAAGHGDGATSIREVSERIHGQCPNCQANAWEVRFLWHDPAGRPPVWRQELDQRVAEAQRKHDLDRGLVA